MVGGAASLGRDANGRRRVITIQGSNDVALIGFGSSVVPSSNQPAQQGMLRDAALQHAQRKARKSLVALLSGQDESWDGSSSMTAEGAIDQFEALPNEGGEKRLADAKKHFRNEFRNTEEYKSVLNGQVPPGTLSSAWVDDQSGFALGFVIYWAGAADTVQQLQNLMPQPQPPAGNDLNAPPMNNNLPRLRVPGEPDPAPVIPAPKKDAAPGANGPTGDVIEPKPAPASKEGTLPSGNVSSEKNL